MQPFAGQGWRYGLTLRECFRHAGSGLAGTFDFTEQSEAMKVGSFSTKVLIKTWTAPGAGSGEIRGVRPRGAQHRVVTTEELLSFTRG